MADAIRYSRLESLEGIGREGIEKLSQGSVLIVGCGALGSPAAMYLAASGVGTIGLADFDTIDISNLQRQVFYDENSLGKLKSLTLKNKIKDLNSEVRVIEYPAMINEVKAEEIFTQFDFIIDGSDNPSTKNNTSSVCERLGLPYSIGGVKEYTGQAMSWAPGHAGYSEIFGNVPLCSGFTPCSIAGVMGPAAGVIASVLAGEAIKYLTGTGTMLYDRLFMIDLFNAASSVI